MDLLADTDLLLDLLREAGDEPVTLDELEIVGVRDPARALFELELAGHRVQRVYEHPRRDLTHACVRLAPPAPAPAPPPVPAAGAPAVPAADGRLVAGALAGVLLVLLLALARRG